MNDIEKIFIDLDDEITFVIERIRESDNKKILLIVPDRAAILSSIVSLKLIFRYCFKNGKDLIVVSSDELGLNIASKAGVVCVSKVSDIDDLLWDKSASASEIAFAKYKSTAKEAAVKVEELESEESSEETIDDKLIVKAAVVGEGLNMTEDIQELADELKVDDSAEKQIEDVSNEEQVTEDAELSVEKDEMPVQEPAEKIEQKDSDLKDNGVKEVNGFVMSSGGDISKYKKAAVPVVAATALKTSVTANASAQGLNTAAKVSQTSSAIEDNSTTSKSTQAPTSTTKKVDKSSLVGKDITSYSFKQRKGVKRSSKPGKVKTPKIGKPSVGFLTNKSNLKFILPIVLLVFVLIGYAYFIAPKADVNLTLEAKQLEATKEVKASSDYSSINLEKLTIPAEVVEANVDGSKNAKATGKKQVGEKATGEVTLFNFTSNDINLASGTIVASGGKNFLLDVDVTIPKKNTPSPDNPEEPILAGTRDVAVTAQSFGTEYNLKDGALFTVANYGSDQLKGKTFKDFSGGTSRDITIVSSKDIDDLKKTILDELKPMAIEQVKGSIGEDKFFLEDQIKFDVKEVTASPAKDQEAQNFDLSVKAVATVTVFSKEDLNQLAEEFLKNQVEDGYSLDENTFDVSSELVKAEGNSITVKLKIKAVAQKQFEQDKVLSEISGKSLKKADELLSNQSAVTDYEVVISPNWLFGPFKHLPSNTAKINTSIQYQDLTETPDTTTE
ncbi:hypothetical protein KC660_02660 [Candidatus Dojkabacteria bacterium]|uniref:Baseplate protein J-like domain-containing protein n=1 Tax=Candidatus Dojkabacteria bacterium TaxID=2099670 RepID=A0A955RHV8_9BACT|nr:hypothetical protein [Candidatus Dojkabacteria bacterium]